MRVKLSQLSGAMAKKKKREREKKRGWEGRGKGIVAARGDVGRVGGKVSRVLRQPGLRARTRSTVFYTQGLPGKRRELPPPPSTSPLSLSLGVYLHTEAGAREATSGRHIL